ncbi:MAG: PP2C family serine/threonine-protein phosphatase [Candidatus Hadarchaeum sp.]|uniref:PP2C family serine/threonine-protein phosphatase n=1 Tax=Candidatus Hadarchaeum sp. TaxID=2883567 RepID=UPI0031825E65
MVAILKEGKYWSILASSRQGAAHRRKGVVNQDALSVSVVQGGIAVAVADGHGSPTSPYSHLGARFAAEAACEQLKEFAERNIKIRNYQTLNDLAAKVPQAIVQEWRRRVDESCVDEAMGLELRKKRILFGTTLLCALLVKDWALLLQLGDGDILCVYDNDEVTTVWHGVSEEFVGEETHSLCEDNAESITQWKIIVPIEPKLALLLLSTDGYNKSFASEADFRKAAVDWYHLLLEHGAEKLREKIDEWLDQTSDQGCGDDITVALLYRAKKAISLARIAPWLARG